MEILFLILKIILALFGCCILLFLAAAAVPVRYRIGVKVQKGPECTAVFSWACHLVHLRIQYGEAGAAFCLRILGFRVAPREKKDRKKNRKNSRETAVSVTSCEMMEEETPESSKEREEGCFGKEWRAREEEDARRFQEEKQSAEVLKEMQKQTGEDLEEVQRYGANGKKKKRLLKRRKRARGREKSQTFAQKAGAWKEGLTGRIVSMKEKVQDIKTFLLEETNKNAFFFVIREIRRLIGHYTPRKASGELTFGMEDPARTGQILGALCTLPFWSRYRIRLYPDFQADKFYASGELWMKGHIRCGHFLWSVFRLIKNKEIRSVIRRFRT